jgi:hypothetical protein
LGISRLGFDPIIEINLVVNLVEGLSDGFPHLGYITGVSSEGIVDGPETKLRMVGRTYALFQFVDGSSHVE